VRGSPRRTERAFASTLEDLLAVVDAVLITTPPSSHAPQVLAAFAAGRHVFCEK
jgi:predicted dehydrogenase